MQTMHPGRLVLIGSILVDMLMYIDRLPVRGSDRLANATLLTSGGGLNVLTGAARLGMSVCYAGRVGDGPMGKQIMADLQAAAIPMVLAQVQGEDSGFDTVLVEADGERTLITAPGTEARLSLEDLHAIPLQDEDAIYVSGYDLLYPISGASLAAWLPELPSAYHLVIDPGPLVADIPTDRLQPVLARTNLLSLNARELQALSGSGELVAGACKLITRLAPGALVVVRDGERGCWLVDASSEPFHAPGRPARVVDTTGAGDVHVAALLACLATGASPERAAQIANVAASLAVERAGPATGPTLAELQRALHTL
jgi:sugar/nucleoside kinase (ribokinase family)